MTYFDYERVAKDAGFTAENLAELSRLVRSEFPQDDMLYELHMLRSCKAVRDGVVTIEEVIHDDSFTTTT
ncbi:MAG: hypothetical protein HY706_06120 [Candidatus Hydrogenedentes bacterium]|nr:hypothetical protein [Candidatus Hydrogenedentota bacterium]